MSEELKAKEGVRDAAEKHVKERIDRFVGKGHK